MAAYKFEIKTENNKAAQTFKWFNFFVTIGLFFFVAIKKYSDFSFQQIILGLGIIAINLFFIINKKVSKKYQYNILIFILPIVLFAILKIWFLVLILLLVLPLSIFINKKKQYIYIDENQIINKNLLSSKKIYWLQIDYLLLKDDILTISFKNNVFNQFYVTSNLINEIDFNSFCINQITNQV